MTRSYFEGIAAEDVFSATAALTGGRSIPGGLPAVRCGESVARFEDEVDAR